MVDLVLHSSNLTCTFGDIYCKANTPTLHTNPTTSASQAVSRLRRCYTVNYEYIFPLHFSEGQGKTLIKMPSKKAQHL